MNCVHTLNPLHVSLEGAESIAFASSDREGSRQWTELGIWFVPSADGRMFLAESKGCSRVEGQTTRRRAVYVGTMERALEFFDDSELADAIRLQADDWRDRNAGRVEAELEKLRAVEADTKKGPVPGYDGSTLLGAVAWLYGDAQAGKAARLAEDFGVPRRTVAHALDQEQGGHGLTGWAKAFIGALKHFNRDAWAAAKGAA